MENHFQLNLWMINSGKSQKTGNMIKTGFCFSMLLKGVNPKQVSGLLMYLL